MSKITQEILDGYRGKEVRIHVLKVDMSKDDNHIDPKKGEKPVLENDSKLSFEDWQKKNFSKEDFEEDSDKIVEKKGVYYALLKTPGRREMGFAMSSSNPLDMGEALISSCWIEGDPEIKAIEFRDTIGAVAAMTALKLMDVGKGSLKKI